MRGDARELGAAPLTGDWRRSSAIRQEGHSAATLRRREGRSGCVNPGTGGLILAAPIAVVAGIGRAARW